MARNNVRRPNKNTVSNVRIVDEFAGSDGAKLDRMLQALHNSQSQTRIEIGFATNISVTTGGADQLGIMSGNRVRLEDEFTTFVQQFQLFKIVAIRYDVYDINPAIVCFSAFSTFHEVSDSLPPSFTFPQVMDGPDTQVATNGAPRLSFSWIAKGAKETEFQSVDTAAADVSDFGGLRWAIGAGSVAGSKYQVVAKAVVDFRGRY